MELVAWPVSPPPWSPRRGPRSTPTRRCCPVGRAQPPVHWDRQARRWSPARTRGGSNPAALVGPAGLPEPSGSSQVPGPVARALGQSEASQAAQAQVQAAQPPPAAPSGVRVDLEVMPRAIGADAVTTAVSNYGCPPGMTGVAQPARNSTGFCVSALQPVLDSALAGGLGPAQAMATIESTLWQQLPAIPLFQMVTTVASTPKGDKATGNIGPGPLSIGPFGTAVGWHPTRQG